MFARFVPAVDLSTSMHEPIEQHQECKANNSPFFRANSFMLRAKKISPTLLARVRLSESCVLQSTRRTWRLVGFRLRIFAGLFAARTSPGTKITRIVAWPGRGS
jgi:hypothetical protein